MEGLIVIFFWLFLVGAFGFISGYVAESRGHNFWAFFFLGALISPLLAIILALIIPASQRSPVRTRRRRKKKRPNFNRMAKNA